MAEYQDSTNSSIGANRPFRKRLFLCAFALALAGVVALLVDLPVARFIANRDFPTLISKPIRLAEIFGHGWGVLIIAGALYSLDPAGRRFLPRILVAAIGAGMVSNAVKLLIARSRPRAFDLNSAILDSFGPWLPLMELNSDSQGVPSSHVAVAAALAVALTWLYPRGGFLFVALALLAALQRIYAEAHFASDVCWGATIGVGFATLCLPAGMPDDNSTPAKASKE